MPLATTVTHVPKIKGLLTAEDASANDAPEIEVSPFDLASAQQRAMLENQQRFFDIQMKQLEELNRVATMTAQSNFDMLRMFQQTIADSASRSVHAKPEVVADLLNGLHAWAKDKGFVV